ncbi:acyl-CoA dehydrogenase [Streptomyces sp. NPDC097619]|uniref:acyl-CoA dehydrogenase n=1 Tax=Streptomyces sp. NPDC097619 TaxID=3157228 RepID=UPI00332B82C3
MPPEVAARAEVDPSGLRRLVHGSCPPDYLHALHSALTGPVAPTPGAPTPTEPPPSDGPARERAVTARMRLLAGALPPARHLLRDPDRLAALLAWTAVADPPLCMAFITHTVLCLGSMAHLAPEHAALDKEFQALETLAARGGYLITEAGQANSHLATRTRAVFDPRTREFVLTTPDETAAKFCGMSTQDGPRTVAVLARAVAADGQEGGVFPFLLDLTHGEGPLPGVEVSSPLTVGALPLEYAQVRFTGARVPYDRWLRDTASAAADGTLHDPLGSADTRLQRTLRPGQDLWGTLPSAAAGIARLASVLAVRYARDRRTQARMAPGRPLLDYRSQQHAVLGSLAESFALTCAAARARTLLARTVRTAVPAPATEPPRDTPTTPGATAPATTGAPPDAGGFAPWTAVSRPLSAYKAHTVRAALRVVATCRSHTGFSGHLDVNRLADYHGFLSALEPAGGDSRLIFYDLGRALAADRPPRPRPAERTAPGDPYPAGARWWQRTAHVHRDRLTRQLRAGRDRRSAAGLDEFEVWNPLLDAAGELGALYAECLAADDVVRALDGPDLDGTDLHGPDAHGDTTVPRDALEALAALGGVRAAQRWSGSLLAAGTLDAETVRALPAAVDRLCDRILPHLPALEAAFGFPDDLVGAPMARPDYHRALTATLTWQSGDAS